MTARALLDEARRRGLELHPEGDHIRVRGRLDAEFRTRLLEHKGEVLEALRPRPRPPAYVALARCEVVDRAAGVLARRPDLFEAVCRADDSLERLERAERADSPEWVAGLDRLRGLIEGAAALADPPPGPPDRRAGAPYVEGAAGLVATEAAGDPPAWTGEAAELVAWFVEARAACRLPVEPFELAPWYHVVEPSRWYEALAADCDRGALGPRGRTGALVDDLERLRRFVGGGGGA